MFSYRFAEATCRSTIRSARGVIEDIGVETAKKSSGLLNIARCSEKKSERDSHRVLDSFGLGLPIPMTDLNVNTTEIDMQILRLRDWMAYILEHNCFHLMCGLMAPDANRECAILSAFWSRVGQATSIHGRKFSRAVGKGDEPTKTTGKNAWNQASLRETQFVFSRSYLFKPLSFWMYAKTLVYW